jgi:hypothetical protein
MRSTKVGNGKMCNVGLQAEACMPHYGLAYSHFVLNAELDNGAMGGDVVRS